MTSTAIDARLTAHLTDTAGGVQVQITDDAGEVTATYLTHPGGGFIRRLDELMHADKYSRHTGYTAGAGDLRATIGAVRAPRVIE